MQKTHGRYEWFVNSSEEIFSGNSILDVWNAMSGIHMVDGNTMKTKSNIYLMKNGIDECISVSELSHEEFASVFFGLLQDNDIGSWKWYDSLIGEKWRFSYQKNDLIRKGLRAPMSEESKAKIMKNLDMANEKLVNDPNRQEYRRRGGYSSMKKETRDKFFSSRDEYFRNQTPEQKESRNKAISDGLKRAWKRRKEQNGNEKEEMQ